MIKYFKVVEISFEEFFTPVDLDCIECCIPTTDGVYVYVDDDEVDEFCIPLDYFNK